MPTLIASDDFTDAGSGNVAITTYSSDWTQIAATGIEVNRDNDNVEFNSGSTMACYWNADTFDDDQYSEADFSSDDEGYSGVSFRCDSGGDGYCVNVGYSGDATAYYFRFDAGTETLIASESITAPSGAFTARIESSGSDHELFLDASSAATTSDSTHASGAPGLSQYTSPGARTADNWEGGNLADPGVTGTGASDLPIPTSSASGESARTGTGASDLPMPTSSASGESARTGTGASDLPMLTSVAAGVAASPISGTGASSLPMFTSSAAGESARAGVSAAVLPMLSSSASGTATGDVTGTGASELPMPVSSASGTRVGTGVTGTSAMTLPLMTSSAHGCTSILTRRFHVDLDMQGRGLVQPDTAGARVVATIKQLDQDMPFFDFIGTQAAGSSNSLSSETGETSAKHGAIRIRINGVDKWIRVYDDPT